MADENESTPELDVSALSDAELNGLMGDEGPGPEPEPEIVAEAHEAPVETPEPEHQAPKHVPLHELLEERGRRKEAQARLEETERRLQEFARYVQSQQPQQPQQPGIETPAYEDDPLGYLRSQQESIRQQQEALTRHLQQREAQTQQAAQWNQMRESVGQAERAFAEKTPDYYDAVNHLRTTRANALAAQGLPEQQIQQVLVRDAAAVAQEAGQLGLSPAEYVYRIALGTGWQAKRAAPAAPRAVAEAPKSLGGASGKTADLGVPSLDDIGKMSDKEFDALWKKVAVGS